MTDANEASLRNAEAHRRARQAYQRGAERDQGREDLRVGAIHGDEDLGEDIIMKGKPFHYDQRPANDKLFATGMNGDEDLGEDIIMKGKPFHYNQN